MLKIVFFILILLGIFGCSSKRNELKTDCKSIKFEQVYFERMSHGNNISYYHFLKMDNFNKDACFNYTDFIQHTKKYFDTCQTKLPIGKIQFIENDDGIDFSSHEPDFYALNKKSIITISFITENNQEYNYLPPIHRLIFYENGEERSIILQNLWDSTPD